MSKLYDCFLSELANVYDAETQSSKALRKMEEAATHDELKAAFKSLQTESEAQAVRMEEVFSLLGEKIPSRSCKGMQGLVLESTECIDEKLCDAALICAAQKMKHYEIATYGCLRSWAQFLDEDEAAGLLDESLDEKYVADEHLTSLAVQIINLDAVESAEEEESAMEHAVKGKGSPSG